jgi:tRNA threonylcarbamoyladenosine biosynthesis protein TsaB
MNILAFDTCFNACSAALLRGSEEYIFSRFEPMAKGHAERLAPMIEEVVSEAGIPFAAISRIAVTCGPGTFTGTRIGVAAARALALALEKPLVASTSLAVMAEEIADSLSAQGHSPNCEILIAMDARHDEVYCQHFKTGQSMGEPAVLSPQKAAELISIDHEAAVSGSAAPRLAAAAARSGRQLRPIRPDLLPSARFLARLAVRLPVMTQAVSPLYLRPADAKPQAGNSIQRVSS